MTVSTFVSYKSLICVFSMQQTITLFEMWATHVFYFTPCLQCDNSAYTLSHVSDKRLNGSKNASGHECNDSLHTQGGAVVIVLSFATVAWCRSYLVLSNLIVVCFLGFMSWLLKRHLWMEHIECQPRFV